MILFSHKTRIVGYLCLIPAILLFIAKGIFKLDLEFLYVPVFAVVSSFIETKYFFWMHSNISEELFAFSLIIGMTLIALSKEKQESDEINNLRLKAFSFALIINGAFLLFGLAFFYGISALYILTINLFSFLFLYILIFKILFYKARKKIITIETVQNGLDN